MPELHKVPNNTKVRVVESNRPPPGARPVLVGEEIMFHHIDGMYSYCHDKQGRVVHLAAWTEVEIVEETDNEENPTKGTAR